MFFAKGPPSHLVFEVLGDLPVNPFFNWLRLIMLISLTSSRCFLNHGNSKIFSSFIQWKEDVTVCFPFLYAVS